MKRELFDTQILQSLDKMALDQARETALGLVEKMPKKTINQSTSVNRITHDLQKAKTPAEVARIMYQVYLSGVGLGTVGSAWKKHYDNV
jgi:hypothetical protein